MIETVPGVDGVAAREKVCGGIAELGPRVDAEVAFLDDDDRGDAVGLEVVRVRTQDCGTSHSGCLAHRLLELRCVVQSVKVCVEKFSDYVTAKVNMRSLK